MLHHTQSAPVHIIGHARSGTSILADVLRRYLHISFGTESQFIVRFDKNLAQYGDLHDEGNIKRLIRDVAQERCFQRWHKFDAFVLDPTQLFRDLPERSYRGVLEAAFMQLARHSGMTRWGDKTPEYVYHLPVLYRLWPDAQYIHIVRDGRDVALSIFQQEFGAKNVYKAASDWREQMLLVRDFSQCMPPEQFLEIRYEDFLGSTGETFRKLADFLGVDINATGFEPLTAALQQEIKADNFNKWRQGLTVPQQRLYEQIAGDVLSGYGYETAHCEAQPMGVAQHWYWTLDDKFRHWIMPAYWRDNVYKASLRLWSLLSQCRRFVRVDAR